MGIRRKIKNYIYEKKIYNKINDNSVKILNVWRKHTKNIGDLVCAPSLYYKELQENSVNIDISYFNKSRQIENKIIIVGGGGLLQNYFKDSIQNIIELSKNNKIIFWGVGIDNYIDEKIIHFDLSSILASSRDNNGMFTYVPCASCLSPLFDKYKEKTDIKGKYALYLHTDYSKEIQNDLKLPYFYNTNMQNFEEALNIISSYEIILTNSYHGLYWSTLLNKKVIILPWIDQKGNKGFSYKFKNFKYNHCMLNDWNDYTVQNNLNNYPNALEECRKENNKFFSEVLKNIK